MTDNNVIQLETDLNRLLDDSLPTWPGLPAESARIAVMMHKSGRDAYAIAERIDKPLGSVLAFLDRVNRRQKAAVPAERPARESLADTPLPTTAGDEVLEDEAALPEPAPPLAPERPRPQRDIRPDVELSDLQQSVICRLRKSRVSANTIARMMRLSPDQVMRVAGEIP